MQTTVRSGEASARCSSALSALALTACVGHWRCAGCVKESVRPAHVGHAGAACTCCELEMGSSPLCLVAPACRTAEETFLSLGASIGYWRGDIKGLVDDIAALRPTLFIGVPRVFDRIYTGVMAKVGSHTPYASDSDCRAGPALLFSALQQLQLAINLRWYPLACKQPKDRLL